MQGNVPKNWTPLRIADSYYASNVYREGNVIHKDAGPWSPSVHALLRHLERVGFPAPRVVGDGFDETGRQTLSYVEGESAGNGPWSVDAAYEIGALLRRLHEATRNFDPGAGAAWFPWHGRDIGSDDKVIGHCDLGPWNIIHHAGVPAAIVDWDFAGPVDPIWELAHVCWLNAKLHDEIVAELEGLPPVEERAAALRAIVDGYELAPVDRAGLVQKTIEIAILDAAAESNAANIRIDTVPGSLAQPVPWAIAWRARAAAWMIRNRDTLEDALR